MTTLQSGYEGYFPLIVRNLFIFRILNAAIKSVLVYQVWNIFLN